ncbi:MAG TPA: DUF1365 domain-containing protein [Solirubrobacteraceae bacterium]|nr:DUF1365 domain-containing protein [Solirubrobacteraceae bacterium]
MSSSCIYEGVIRHRRSEPRREFRHRLALAYLDLQELPGLLGGRLVSPRPGLMRFRRRDYLGDPAVALDRAVRELVSERTGERPAGPIRLLAHPRSFGHCFNPVSFYYCFDGGERVQALLAEVTNTPWGERQVYVLGRESGSGRVLHGDSEKLMHVSPFFGMNQRYDWRVAEPGRTLSVHIENREAGQRTFDATLALERRPLTRRSLAAVTARHPAATLRVLALIYAHAAAIRLSGIRTRPHPARVAG